MVQKEQACPSLPDLAYISAGSHRHIAIITMPIYLTRCRDMCTTRVALSHPKHGTFPRVFTLVRLDCTGMAIALHCLQVGRGCRSESGWRKNGSGSWRQGYLLLGADACWPYLLVDSVLTARSHAIPINVGLPATARISETRVPTEDEKGF